MKSTLKSVIYVDLSFEFQTQTFNCLLDILTYMVLRHLKPNLSQTNPSSVPLSSFTQGRKPGASTPSSLPLLPRPKQLPGPAYPLPLTQLTLILLSPSRDCSRPLVYTSAGSTSPLPEPAALTPSNHICKSLPMIFLKKISICHSTADFIHATNIYSAPTKCQSLS